MSTNEPNPSHELPFIKLEPESSEDEDMLPQSPAFNSDQDDGGSNIWDFTDEEFNDEDSASFNNSDIADSEKPANSSRFSSKFSSKNQRNSTRNSFMDSVKTSLLDNFEEFDEELLRKKQERQLEYEERFKAPEQKTYEDEKTLNSIFFQSIDWRKINHDFPYAIPQIKDFDVVDGVKVATLLKETDPYRFFTEFLQDEFLELVAFYTNQNAKLDPKFQNPHKAPWKTVDKEDIRGFFGLLFLFGLMKKPNISAYWSEDPLISTECMFRIMPKTFFARIKRYICFYDKTKPKPVGDSFYKIRSFQDHVLNNSKRIYVPERDLSVDESIILYTGLHRLKVWHFANF